MIPNATTTVKPIRRTYTGLSNAEVIARVKRGESNDFEPHVGRTYFDIVRENLFNLFNIVLGTMLVIIIVAKDYSTAFFAGFAVVSNSFVGTLQEINAKRKLDKLAALSQQKVKVWREGKLREIPMKQVVKDDVIYLEPGDRVAVDGVVIETNAMEVDESQLTGESDAVFKEIDDELHSGSFCIAGTGVMVATKVGAESTINKLSTVAKKFKKVLTPTQQKVYAFVELSVLLMFILGPMLFISGALKNISMLDAVRNAVVFVTSLVPQGLVLVTILSLTIGAIKISMKQTLIQRVNAVESLANATVLCFDKTGTLTRNELKVAEIIPAMGKDIEHIHNRLYNYLVNLAHLNRTAGAVQEFVDSVVKNPQFVEKISEIPFTSGRKWGAVEMPDATLIMGAPERLIDDSEADKPYLKQARELSRQGMRVLAFVSMAHKPVTDQIRGQANLLALIVLSDQVREDIHETLSAFREENIELKVISGDNIETVQAIARQSGIEVTEAYTGEELDAMTEDELEGAVQRANLFARVEPDTKRRIVKALQNQGHYVAMTGDGVNDVPALKQADLSIVMNDGAQITKDVADIVLLNNAMSTLPQAFFEGKETTQTVFGTMKMFLVKNFYNVMLFIFVGFMNLPFPITPIQISWSAFGTVNMPATFIAFGWVRPKYMEKFRRDVVDYILTVGLMGSALMALLYVVVFFSSQHDIMLTRSVITIYTCLFGMLIVWHIQGVDFLEPKTFRIHWRVVLLSVVMTIATILSMYALPGLFEFVPLTRVHFRYIVLIIVVFNLNMMLASWGMRYRYLLNRMWMLLAP